MVRECECDTKHQAPGTKHQAPGTNPQTPRDLLEGYKAASRWLVVQRLQGYLAHKKTPPPLGLP